MDKKGVAAARTEWADRGLPSAPVLWAWAAIWVLTRAFIAAHVGFWDDVGGIDYEDVHQFEVWSDQIVATGTLPSDSAWQYPPGAALMMLVPRIGADYGETFVIMMLLVDLVALMLLFSLGRRRGNFTGVWVWLLGMPLLRTLPLLRFDLLPTVVAMAGLVVIHRRPTWFGSLVGIGAALKVWPVVLLFGEWDRRRLTTAAGAAVASFALIAAVTFLLYGNPFTFLSEQGGRGLQVEAIATAPWQLREVVTGTQVPEELRYGAWEIPSGTADTVAGALDFAALLVFAAAAWWWRRRDRAIRAGRKDLADETVARDFVFAIVLLLVVVSQVLSPQFMIWMLGLAAVVLTASDSRMRRPAWIVLGTLIFFSGSAPDAASNILIRNLGLVVAAADACYSLWLYLRPAARTELAAVQ